jgi:hypothetical protein
LILAAKIGRTSFLTPVDGSPKVLRFDATTLWRLDAAEWMPDIVKVMT